MCMPIIVIKVFSYQALNDNYRISVKIITRTGTHEYRQQQLKLTTLESSWDFKFGVESSSAIKGPRCFIEQETLLSLLSTGWFQERIRA